MSVHIPQRTPRNHSGLENAAPARKRTRGCRQESLMLSTTSTIRARSPLPASRASREISLSYNRRSKLITHGIARSPNRAMLRAVGFGDDDFDKPIVGVANGHSTMNPCNAGIQPLVDRAMAALRDAGAMPQVFGFPTVTDGIGMGTEGMKYSLVSREVIADAIET